MMKTSSNIIKSVQVLPLLCCIMLGMVFCCGVMLNSGVVYADGSSATSSASVTVSAACTLSGTGMDSHNAEINNGQHNSNIGTTTLKAFCNDNEGFSIYAVGYTDNEIGKNVLTNSTLGPTHDIVTGTEISGNTSNWAMKLATVSNPTPTYPIIIMGSTDDTEKQEGDPDYSAFQNVPSSYAKVAKRESSTDVGTNAEGTTLTTTYQAYISPTQAAGTYTGQVKYTMVHPSNGEDNANSALCSNDELQKWNYTLNDNGTVTLHYYMGTNNNGTYVADENVVVCGSYEANDTVYDTVIDSNTNTSTAVPYMFNAKNLTQNSDIVSIYFDKGVDMSSTTGINYMFYHCSSLTSLDVSNLDTSNVTAMRGTFNGVSSLTNLDVSNFDTSKVTTMRGMFDGMNSLTSIDLSNFDTSNVTAMDYMFNKTYSLTSLDLSSFDTSNVTTMRTMFQYANSLTSLDLSSFNTSKVTDMAYMFFNASDLESVNVSSLNTSKVTSMEFMFGCDSNRARDCSLASLDLSNFDTSNVTTMYSMFQFQSKLTSLDVSSFNTSKVTDMAYMFSQASSLTSLDLSSFDTSNVTTMRGMLATGKDYVANGKISEIKGLNNFNTAKVTDMTVMFYGNGQMTSYDIAGWDVSKVESFNHMFCDNRKLTSLDLSEWNVSSVKTMYDMFDDNYALTTIGDISHWNTTNLIDIGGFLNGASSFVGDNGTLDLSGWNTANLKAAGEMFRATKLKNIDLTGWTFSSITNNKWSGAGSGIYYETGNTSSYKGMAGMFLNMPNLEHVYISEGVSIPENVNVNNMWGGSTPISDFTVVPNE